MFLVRDFDHGVDFWINPMHVVYIADEFIHLSEGTNILTDEAGTREARYAVSRYIKSLAAPDEIVVNRGD